MSLAKFRIKSIAIAVIAAFSFALMPVAPVSAAIVGNERVINEQTVQDDRLAVQNFMERDDVRAEFEALGVSPREAQARVATLSDMEVAHLADQIEQMPAGQGALGSIIGAAVLIFIVLLITDLLGFTSVFGFTNKGSANPS